MLWRWIVVPSLLAASAPQAVPPPGHVTVAVAQARRLDTISANRDRMIDTIREAAGRSARVVVFPEGALSGSFARGSSEAAAMSGAVSALRRAAVKHGVYVIYGGPPDALNVIGPLGNEIAARPGFSIDNVPAHALLGSERRVRSAEERGILDGARISFELADDPESGWVPGLTWHAQVARAMRNNVWVVLASAANPARGRSAVIAPDGEVVSALDRGEGLLFMTLDGGKATRAGAVARRNHPGYEQPSRRSRGAELTVAAAQVVLQQDTTKLWNAVRESAAKGARVVAFPARALKNDWPATLQHAAGAAKESGVYVAIGAGGAAYVFSPSGEQLTRYVPGGDPARMWFEIDGVTAIVTMGERDALWNEISETAAAAGAGERNDLERRQIGAAMASYGMITAVVNAAAPSAAGHSALWDDLAAEPGTGVRLASPSTADLVAEAGRDETILFVKRRVASKP